MAVFVLTITLTEDGQVLSGYPIQRTITTQESAGRQQYTRPDAAATFTELAISELGDLNLLVVEADQAVTYRFNDQTDAGIPMKQNGILLLLDSNILSTATSKASVENASGSAATVTQVAAGT